MTASAVALARRLADEVLFPRSLSTDAAAALPRDLLDLLADAGLYGLLAPPEVGGLGLGRDDAHAVIEALAGGCLTTTFVWIQHLSTAAIVAGSEGVVRDEWARLLATGERRSGIAFSHLRHGGPPVLTASPVDGGYVVDGVAPLVTGWGLIDVVHLAARHDDDIIWLLVDAEPAPSLTVRRLRLAAVNASATVGVRFDEHFVAASRLTVVQPLAEWLERDAAGLRTNGSLSLGVAERAISLLEVGEPESGSAAVAERLREQLAATRQRLDEADVVGLPEARARASLFALDVTAALIVASGGRAMVLESQAQRLQREAMFLLVQGQTRPIRAAQLGMLAQRSASDARGIPSSRHWSDQ